MAINATTVATNPIVGISLPISKPSTITAPEKPNKTPIHCFRETFSFTFLIAMSHQIFLVSFGAFTILMFLIKRNSASKTVSIFFLIPPTSALMAWLFLNESLSNLDLLGFLIATIGVYIATRD